MPTDTDNALPADTTTFDQDRFGSTHFITTPNLRMLSSPPTDQTAISSLMKTTPNGLTNVQSETTKPSSSSYPAISTDNKKRINPMEEARQVAHSKEGEYLKHIQRYALALDIPLKWRKVKEAFTVLYMKKLSRTETEGGSSLGPYNRAGTGTHFFARLSENDGVNAFPWPQNVTVTGLPHDTRWIIDTPLEFWCWDMTKEQYYCQELSFLLHLKFGAEQYHQYTSTTTSLFSRYHDMATSTNMLHDSDNALRRWFRDLPRICTLLPGCPCRSDQFPYLGAVHYIDVCLDYKLPSNRLRIGNKKCLMSIRDLFTPNVLQGGFQRVVDKELFCATPGEWGWVWNHDPAVVRNWYGYWLLSWADRSRRKRLQYSAERHMFGFLAYIHHINEGFEAIDYQHQTQHDLRVADLFLYWDHENEMGNNSFTCMDTTMTPTQWGDHRRLAYGPLLQQRFIVQMMASAGISNKPKKRDKDCELPEWLAIRDPHSVI
jgi:hypothetical protein